MIKMYFTTVIQYCATSETDMIYRNIKWIKDRNPFYLISYRIFISFTVFCFFFVTRNIWNKH